MRNGHESIVATLLERGAQPNMATPEGTTPMHAANTVPIATALLQRGANMHAFNNVRAKSYLMLPYTVKKGFLNPIIFLFL